MLQLSSALNSLSHHCFASSRHEIYAGFTEGDLKEKIMESQTSNSDVGARNDQVVGRSRKIGLSVLAIISIALPAIAQNQSLTSFRDSFNGFDHIYYQHDGWLAAGAVPPQAGTPVDPNNYDLFQIAPTVPWAGDMNQLGGGCTGYPPATVGSLPTLGSPLAGFEGGSFGQSVLYVDNMMHVRVSQINLHVVADLNNHLAYSDYQVCSNWDLTAHAKPPCPSSGTCLIIQNGTVPVSDGKSLAGFSDERGGHAYYRSVDGHVHHLWWVWSDLTTISYVNWEDLTNVAGLKASLPCGVSAGTLTAFVDRRSNPSIELVYYVGTGGGVVAPHLCELAWYQRKEQSYDLTNMMVYTPPQPMMRSPLTGFVDAGGQHVFYLDTQHHVYQFLVGPGGLSNVDLTSKSGGNPAVADSLTSFSNAWGPQVFYVDSSLQVNQIDVNASVHRDLSALSGGNITQPASTLANSCPSWGYISPGTPLSSIGLDDKGGGDVFYVGLDRHVWLGASQC